jgi:predicted O-linked N-acetylglucosamine transferase (SPINDLY family)
MSTPAIARNAPCPCGSGKRFKDCHGAPGSAADSPAGPDALLQQAQVSFAGGQAAAAKALLVRALALAPERADLVRERARLEWTLGEPTAAASCRTALERAPGDVAAWNLFGEILFKAGDGEGAEDAWRRALELDAENPESLFHLGNRLRERGDRAAISHYERALQRAPGHPGILNNLGLTLEAAGETERAEDCYRQVLAAESQHPDALANLANLLKSQKRYREAVLAYERALAVRRDFPVEFWTSRAIALDKLGALSDAEASLREAARLQPERMRTHLDIGALCVVQGKFDEAEAPLARALELDPDSAYAVTMFTYSRMQRCVWEGLDERFAQLRRLLSDPARGAEDNPVPFPLLAMPLGPEIELAVARRLAQQIAAPLASVHLPPAAELRPRRTRLRIGYVSSDFRDHPVSHLLLEVWERHDRSRIETFAYGLMPADKSAFGQRIESAFEHFVDCYEEGFEATARRIRGDGIDVLIDLNGYTTHARSELFALKPAPVQISWLGYLGTLGAPWYDYVLTDRFAGPPELQAQFSERFLYLPDCYCPSDTRREVAAVVPDRRACGLPERGLVFCCFNNSYKILPEVFALWMRLLSAVPQSVLWLAPGTASAGVNLRREAAARGVDPARLIMAARVSLPEHLARHAHADLFLDTTPYNAGTTANDALFMGVPVLSCSGTTLVSRIAGSQLHAAGLPELATTSLAEYEALARKLATEPALLARYRQRLAANRALSPLFDMTRFTRALDDLLCSAWENRRSVEIL